MENSERMEENRLMFASAIKECMKTTPLSNITVAEIATVAHSNRQTFYRCFHDKYDLINWYFDRLLLESFKEMGNGRYIYDGLVRKFRYIQSELLFFSVSFRNDDQNNLKVHDFEMIYSFYLEKIREKMLHDPDSEICDLLEMYCKSAIYMTVKWVLEEIRYTPEELANLMIDALPLKLKNLFISLNLLKRNVTE